MDVDVEVQLTNVPRPVALELAKQFPVEFASEKTDPQDIVVGPTSQQPTLEKAIGNFLAELAAHGELIKQSRGTLRVGLFYDLDETVVFPFRLSADMVRALGALNLAVDATGYPCKEDD